MDLSVIIPTRDRSDYLRDCLASLGAQTDAPSMQVIVVDDGSTDDTASVAKASGAIVVSQDPSGLNAARNAGAQQAEGRILAFVDDDIVAAPGWARALVDGFSKRGCDAAAGRIVLRYEAERPRWLEHQIEMFLSGLDLGEGDLALELPQIPFGANCAVSAETFETSGGFAPGLDREGTNLLSNGDKEFFVRLMRDGASVWYIADARVEHRVPPSRLTKQWFRRRAWWQGVSDALLQLQHDEGGSPIREVGRAARALPILGLGLLRGKGTFNAQLWVRYCLGRASKFSKGK